jgi:hypothetical protein
MVRAWNEIQQLAQAIFCAFAIDGQMRQPETKSQA